MAYKIVRFYHKSNKKVTIAKGLTLAEAQAHCRNPETSSKTATTYAARKRTETKGPWFDGFDSDR